jgi:TonB family protein
MGMKKILVIDYDQGALASLQGILIKEGYQVVTAGDGQAGWEKFNKESPDLVLMEAMLPKVHGFELCQRITSERNAQAPVFIMTGVYKDRVYRTEALRTYGASEYFEKPLKMAELLASVEAVLGKPERKPAEEPVPAEPAKEARPKPAPADPRKVDKPKPVEEEFAWSADLEKLRREMPKTTIRAPSRHDPSIEARLDTIANELLRTAGVEPTPHHKAVEDKPQERAEHKDNGNGNGNGNVDIDQFLKSALAGLDLSKEKVKVPKTAPLPPPPPAEKPHPAPPPVIVKPKPTPPPPPAVAERPAAERPKPAPVAPPAAAFSQPEEPAPSVTLTPGDPGSDASPFFTPDKKKTEKLAEKPRTAAPPPAPKRPTVEERAAPSKPGTKAREAEVISSSQIFSEICGDKPKKAFSPLLAVGAGIAVIAVIGFFILRPKRPAGTADDGLKSQQTVTQSNVAEKPAEEVPPPEAKPKPAAPKPKVETQTTVADIGPSSEDAILLPVAPADTPPSTIGKPIAPGDGQGQNAAGSEAVQADPPLIKTEGSAPPAKIEENPTQGAAGDAGTAANPGTAAATPAKPQINEGDLVDLASVAEPPVMLKTVDPIYPPSAQRIGVGGSITINALIDEKGNVIDTGILKGIQDDKGLGKAAETAVKKWKFRPAKKDGVNVKVWKPFVIVFKTADKNG